MGARGVARNGIAADASLRTVLGNFTTRLRGWLSPRRAGLLDRLSALRLARIVYRRRVARFSGDLHSRARSGIAGLATRPRSWRAPAIEDVDLRSATRRLVHLCRAAHDRVQLHVARDPGSLSDLSRKTARLRREREIDDQYCLCDRCDLWRCGDGFSFATMGTSARYHSIGNLRNVAHTVVDFRAEHSAADIGRISDPVHGPRRVGRGAGAFERTVAAGISRYFSRTRVSAREFRRGLRCSTASLASGTFPIVEWTTKLRHDHGAGRGGCLSCDYSSRRNRARGTRQRILIN